MNQEALGQAAAIEVQVEAIDELRDEWDELADALGEPPFNWGSWFALWAPSFEVECHAYTARAGGKLLGVIAMQSRRGAVLRSATNWHTPVFDACVETDEVRRRLLTRLTDARRLDLGFVPSDRALIWQEILPSEWRINKRTILSSPYLDITGPWEAYWRSRSKNLRSMLRRCRNRLSDRGEVSVREVDGLTDLDHYLDRAFDLEASGWKAERGTAITSSSQTRRFYSELAKWAAKRGMLKLAFLEVDENPMAFQLCLDSGGRRYLVKLGHDATLQKYGPGSVLSIEMLESAFRAGLDSYEFLGGPDPYKMRLASGLRERVRLQAFAPSFTGGVDYLCHSKLMPVARSLRQRARNVR